MSKQLDFWALIEELSGREILQLQLNELQEKYDHAVAEIVRLRMAQSDLTEIDVWLDLKDEGLVDKGAVTNRFYRDDPARYWEDLIARRQARRG